ncbi:hypothetical protein SAMN05443529_11386 [Desulfosporosinus hippei DSM 8344]|uniref:Uncharacterized protein n=1 Tax=Desulfosporosinus hippei DSM 8344 TaxID=1121419 RepID=A0A1G8CFB1_9FIRM|nr:hypothetical protein SAMN05443529_11386 [Desulfosporosinus hippei DSM 8344]
MKVGFKNTEQDPRIIWRVFKEFFVKKYNKRVWTPKAPAYCEGEEEMESHFCLAHYLIDSTIKYLRQLN